MSSIPAVLLKVLVLICLIVAIPACDNAALRHLNQGDQYIKQGLTEQAIVEYDKAINVDPVLSSSHIAKLDEKYRLLLATAYQAQAMAAMSKGESGTARDAFTRAIEFNPSLAEAYCSRAIVNMESGAPYWGGATWDEVFADCNRAIELKPDYAKAYDARGFAHYKMGKYEQGITDCSKAIELDPNDAQTYYHRGLIYYGQKQWDLALPDFSKSIELDSNGLHVYYYRGIIYNRQGKWDSAITDLSRVAARASIAWPEPRQELARSYYQRSIDYITQGQLDKAIADLKKVIELSGDAELKAKAKQKLEELGVKER